MALDANQKNVLIGKVREIAENPLTSASGGETEKAVRMASFSLSYLKGHSLVEFNNLLTQRPSIAAHPDPSGTRLPGGDLASGSGSVYIGLAASGWSCFNVQVRQT